MSTFRTRREQIEKDFLPRCLKTPNRKVVRDELRDAAMVGACEERERTMRIIENSACLSADKRQLISSICKTSVLSVLGY